MTDPQPMTQAEVDAFVADWNAPRRAREPRPVPRRWNAFYHPEIRHRGYGFAGARRAKAQGYPAIDWDFHVLADGTIVNLHDPTLAQNGFGHSRDFATGILIWPGPLRHLTWPYVREARGPDGIRVRRAGPLLAHAKRLRLRVEFEPKPCPGFHQAKTWERVARIVKRTGVDLQVKANSETGLRMLELAHSAGLTTILLPRGDRRVSRDCWRYVDYRRGPVTWV